MSFVHYLTIGRFTYTEGAEPATLTERVAAHFIPDGLRRLERGICGIQPFTDDELGQIEEELRRRREVDVALREYLTEQGLLYIRYTNVRLHLAEHVAMIAHELFGAVAGERGQLRSYDSLRQESERYAVQEAECRRLHSIKNGVARIHEIVQALQRPGEDPRQVPIWDAVDIAADVASLALPELIAALSAEHEAVRRFAAFSLERLGASAAIAVPSLVAAIRDTRSSDGYPIVLALAAMGKVAEEGLVLALDHHDNLVRSQSIEALGALDDVSDATRARLVHLAANNDSSGKAARKALGRLDTAR